MMINIITIYSDDLSLKKKMITIIRGGREGGGQRVMIEIIISENADNDGWRPGPLAACVMAGVSYNQ